jgi:triacylglycerol lipase
VARGVVSVTTASAVVSAVFSAGLALLLSSGTGCSHSGGSSGFVAAGSTAAPVASLTRAGATTGAVSSATAAVGSASAALQFGTRDCWPIVLVHGFPGWNSVAGVEYFYQVPETLQQNGFVAYVTDQSPINTIETRAQQIHDELVAQYPDPRVKFNFIGHSMGGLDIRYLITALGFGDRAASATTISTPHHGTVLADISFGLVPTPFLNVSNLFFGLIGWNTTGGQELTTSYCNNTFNVQVPNDPQVAYFSWAGHADATGSDGCVIDPALAATWMIVGATEGDNDGLISVASAQWGTFEGTIPADHWGEVGQPLGITSPNFDHKQFYETWAEQLEAWGFGP